MTSLITMLRYKTEEQFKYFNIFKSRFSIHLPNSFQVSISYYRKERGESPEYEQEHRESAEYDQ